MRLALVQFNSLIGDMQGNARRMGERVDEARRAGADLVVFPELAICGYPPKDLLLQSGFVAEASERAQWLGTQHSAGLTLVFGCPLAETGQGLNRAATRDGEPRGSDGVSNSLLCFRDGRLVARYDKRLLPTYDVFDEDRYFVPGSASVVIDVPSGRGKSVRVGLSICEDLWRGDDAGFAHRYRDLPDPVAELCGVQADGSAGAKIIVNPSASPFVMGKGKRHREILRSHALRHQIAVAAVNVVGGNDELVFDGHAAVYDRAGVLIGAGPGFREDVVVVDVSSEVRGGSTHAVADPALTTSDDELLYHALVLGVRDYLQKTGFRTAILGLSGGIDSAVTGVIAVAAIGASNVRGIRLPSRYSSQGSLDDAQSLGDGLGIACSTIPIEPAVAALEESLAPSFVGKAPDVTEENIQSRVRGTILMALSNKTGAILLTTGNKSELAVGYCTLYGDMNGGLAVLSDVTKQWVYRLARWMNAHPEALGIPGLTTPPIPEASITKPPSAELRPDQTDQDSLPEYPVLDEIIERFVERRQAPATIAQETGYPRQTIAKVLRLIEISEYKRKQSAIGIKVTGVAFGSGRRAPVAQGYRADRRL